MTDDDYINLRVIDSEKSINIRNSLSEVNYYHEKHTCSSCGACHI